MTWEAEASAADGGVGRGSNAEGPGPVAGLLANFKTSKHRLELACTWKHGVNVDQYN